MSTLKLEEQMKLIEENAWNIKNIDSPYAEVCLEAVKKDGAVIKHIKNIIPKVSLYAFLNDSNLFKYDDEEIQKDIIHTDIKTFSRGNISLDNMVFYNTSIGKCSNENDKKLSKYKNKIESLYDKSNYDLINIDINSLHFFKDYLVNRNSNNCFILDDTFDLDLLKLISKSDNELIIVDTGNTTDTHKRIADRIISRI